MNPEPVSEAEYSTVLEIKSNGSRLASGWTTFLFVLKGQEFVPYLLNDKTNPRGCLKIAGCQAAKLPFESSDGKKYTFKLASETTAYVFNASNEITRERMITLLNFAAVYPNWFNPYSLTATVELSEDENEVSKMFFSSLHAKVAARRLQGFFFYIAARRRVSRLVAQYPELYLVSVNKIDDCECKTDLFAYVSGLVVKPDPANVDIFNQPHKTTAPVCMASTPAITSATAFHVAIAAHSSALSYLSVSLFPVEEKDKPLQESLGIAFVPLSDVPRRQRNREYTPYTTALPLEPYLVPNLTVSLGHQTPAASGPTAPPAGPLTAQGYEHAVDDNQSAISAAFRDLESASNVGHRESLNVPVEMEGQQSPVSAASPAHALPSTVLRGPSLPNAVAGCVSLTIYTPPPAYTMCGWLLKKSDTWMFGGSYRPYWFVLMNGELQYFQQQPGASLLTLDQPKKLILCQNITAVTYKNGAIAVHFKQRGAKGVWHLKSSPEHAPSGAASPNGTPNGTPAGSPTSSARHPLPPVNAAMVERMWVRKLVRCSPNLPDPALQAAANKALFPAASVSTRSLSTKTHSVDGMPHELVRTFAKERRPSTIKVG